MARRPELGSLLGLGFSLVAVCGWWTHNNSAAGEAYATQVAANATAGSYDEDVETADCTLGCDGQEGGWTWARQHRIAASIECPGSARSSFREGCQAYADTYNDAYDDALSNVDGG